MENGTVTTMRKIDRAVRMLAQTVEGPSSQPVNITAASYQTEDSLYNKDVKHEQTTTQL